jgi:hypothetical protein
MLEGAIDTYNSKDTTTFCSILDFSVLLLKVYTARKRMLPKSTISLMRVLIVSHAVRLTSLFGRKHVVIDKGDHF